MKTCYDTLEEFKREVDQIKESLENMVVKSVDDCLHEDTPSGSKGPKRPTTIRLKRPSDLPFYVSETSSASNEPAGPRKIKLKRINDSTFISVSDENNEYFKKITLNNNKKEHMSMYDEDNTDALDAVINAWQFLVKKFNQFKNFIEPTIKQHLVIVVAISILAFLFLLNWFFKFLVIWYIIHKVITSRVTRAIEDKNK